MAEKNLVEMAVNLDRSRVREAAAPAGPCNNPNCARRIRELEYELNRLRSVGLDVLKQRGHWQASGPRPEDLGLEYDNLFNHEVEDMAEKMSSDAVTTESGEVLTDGEAAMTNSEARQLLSSAFQDVYNSCKEMILVKLSEALSRVLVLPEKNENDEELYDVCRAYGLLVNAAGIQESQAYTECRTKTCSKLNRLVHNLNFEDLTMSMSELSWKMLSNVPPIVCAEITDAPFSSSWHDKEMKPLWDDKLEEPNFSLVYYRPILFFSYEGKVAQKGWVGNKPLKGLVMHQNREAETKSDDVWTDSERLSRREEGNPYGYSEEEKVYKDYKVPSLKVAGYSSHGYELCDLHPEQTRMKELESTVILDDPFTELEDDQFTSIIENTHPAEGTDISKEPIGLKKFL